MIERLVRFVKENFLVGRVFWNITDLNRAALDWCNRQNGTYHIFAQEPDDGYEWTEQDIYEQSRKIIARWNNA